MSIRDDLKSVWITNYKLKETDYDTLFDSVWFKDELGDFSSAIDITYADLISTMASSGLASDKVYRITNFKTFHFIDGMPVGTTITAPQSWNDVSPIEPLLVKAKNGYSLFKEAYSTTYPNDVLEYEANPVDTTDKSVYGKITYRLDPVNKLEAFYDWRNFKFIRSETVLGSGIYDSTTAHVNPTYNRKFTTFSTTGSYYNIRIGQGKISSGDTVSTANNIIFSTTTNNVFIGSDNEKCSFCYPVEYLYIGNNNSLIKSTGAISNFGIENNVTNETIVGSDKIVVRKDGANVVSRLVPENYYSVLTSGGYADSLHVHNITTDSLSADALGTAALIMSEHVSANDHTKLHNPLTVSNTSSVNLTLNNQALSASVNFGTTSTTVAQGNHTHAVSGVTNLQTLLDSKQVSGSYVKSVNSYTPDVSGNVTLAVSGIPTLQTLLDSKQVSGNYVKSVNLLTPDTSGNVVINTTTLSASPALITKTVSAGTTGMGTTITTIANPGAVSGDGWYNITSSGEIHIYYGGSWLGDNSVTMTQVSNQPYVIGSNNEDVLYLNDSPSYVVLPSTGLNKEVRIVNQSGTFYLGKYSTNHNNSINHIDDVTNINKWWKYDTPSGIPFILSDTKGDVITLSARAEAGTKTDIVNTTMLSILGVNNSGGWGNAPDVDSNGKVLRYTLTNDESNSLSEILAYSVPATGNLSSMVNNSVSAALTVINDITLDSITNWSSSASNAITITNTDPSISPDSGAFIVSGGVGIGGDVNIGGNTVISGDLTVNGNTTTINSTEVTIDDPIFVLADNVPSSADVYDRGIEFRYYNESEKTGFFGLDNSTNKFTYIPDATNTDGIISGSTGEIDAKLDWSNLQNISTNQYHGVVRTTNSFNALPTHVASGGTFTLSASANPFDYYFNGTKVTVNSDKIISYSGSASDLYFVYFDGTTGDLATSTTFPGASITSNIIISAVLWDGSTLGLVTDEMHSHNRDLKWYAWTHKTVGTRWVSGSDVVLSGTGATGAMTVGAGEIMDEDISFISPASSLYPTPNAYRIFYQNSVSSVAFDTTLSTVPYKADPANVYRPQYVNSSAGYALTTLPSATNRYINFFCYASLDKLCPIYIFAETSTSALVLNGYTNITNARAIPWPNLSVLGLSSAELKPIHRIIVRADGAVQVYAAVDDYRTVSSLPQSAGTSSTTASIVSFTPYDGIASTNVQTAIEELANEKASLDGANFTNTVSGTNILLSGSISATLALTDNTINNVSVSAHGFVPKLSGVSTDVFRGDGTYSALDFQIDGGNAFSVHTPAQKFDGGNA